MDEDEKGHWVSSDFSASAIPLNPPNSHYEIAVWHVGEIYRVRPPLNHNLLGAPHSCAEAIENMFGLIEQRMGVREPGGWAPERLKAFGIVIGTKAEELLRTTRRMWNQDKHGSREGDAVKAFQTATPEFAVDLLNLTGALLAAFFFRWDGSCPGWIRFAHVVDGALALPFAIAGDQREMMVAWGISVEGF